MKRKMESKLHGDDGIIVLTQLGYPTKLLLANWFASLIIASLVWFLPHVYVDENLVPDLRIFTARPYLFHSLVVAITLSFSGSSGALLIGNVSGHVTSWKFYYGISMVSMTSALFILAWVSSLEFFNLISTGFKLWQHNEDGTDSFSVFRYVKR